MSRSTQRVDRFDLQALYETSRLLSGSLDLEFVLDNLLLTAMSKLLVTRGLALLHEPVEGEFRVAAARGVTAFHTGQHVRLKNIPDGLVHGVDVPEPLADLHFRLLLPVRYAERSIGLIGVGAKATGQPFAKDELKFVQSLVNMSATAIHNSIVVEELRQANRDLGQKVQQLNTLFDLSQEFNFGIERNRLVKTFTYALMGQLLVGKHAFFLRQTVPAEGEDPFDIVSIQGLREEIFSSGFAERVQQLVLIDEETDGYWKPMQRCGLVIALPLKHQGETAGVLCLGPKMTGQPYVPEDIEFLTSLGTLAVVSIRNVELIEERMEKQRLEEEMRMAREIQKRLLPSVLPSVPGLEIGALALPSREVGGDYFDVVPLPEDRLLAIIADVTGKGVPAALLMSSIQACMHTMMPMPITLEHVMGHINRVICQNTAPDKFITAFAAIYYVKTRRLDFVNAGHEPPMVIRRRGGVERLDTGGLLLGVLSMIDYDRGSIQLETGDYVVFFTDGVTEAMDPSGEEYTDGRLLAEVCTHQSETAQRIVDLIQADVEAFTGPLDVLSDDRTMIILKVTDP